MKVQQFYSFHAHIAITIVFFAMQSCGYEYQAYDNVLVEKVQVNQLSTTKRILHQGIEFVALVQPDGTLVIEGDIVVYPGHYIDLDEEEHDWSLNSDELGVHKNQLSIVGNSYRWKNGIIYYEDPPTANPANDFSLAQRQEILNAMADIEEVAPGIEFIERDGESDYIKFEHTANTCSSPVGRQGGSQTIKYANGCFGNFSIHHEIFHSLGLFHNQSRDDRGDAGIVINWPNIQGCPANATGPDDCGSCNNSFSSDCCDGFFVACPATQSYVAHNFEMHAEGKKIGPYDYSSIMHYDVWYFTNGRGDSITSPNPIGLRNAFSEGDILRLNAMYPTLEYHDTFFANSGLHDLCWLKGREQDVATNFGFPHNYPDVVADRENYDGSFALQLDTATMPESLWNMPIAVYCDTSSPFWTRNYSYPNENDWSSNWSDPETRSVQILIRVLDPGLIPVLFSTIL